MYKQFYNYSSINTSERDYIKKFGINNKINSIEMFNNIFIKNKEKKWKPFHKRNKYFSHIPLLISKTTSRNFYINNKCCVDYHIYKRKDKLYFI